MLTMINDTSTTQVEQENMFLAYILLLGCFLSADAWTARTPPTCSMNDKRYKHELDMLSRFTGHGQLNRYTKNWVRQRALKKTYHLPPNEHARDLCFRDEHDLALVGSSRQWHIDLDASDVVLVPGQTLDPTHRHFLSPSRRYSTYYNKGRHVVEMNGESLVLTDAYPYFVRESLDGDAVMVGLCAEEMVVVKLNKVGLPSTVHKLHTDVTLASASSNHLVFNGLFNGQIMVYDMVDGKESSYFSCDTFNSIRSLEAESLGSTVLLYIGFQDGCVKGVKYDPFMMDDQFHEFCARNLHRSPVSRIRMSSGRVVTCDESGRVIVSDLHATKTMYNLDFATDDDHETFVDITDRYLVVAKANKVHVWDHGQENELPRPKKKPRYKNKGGGGKFKLSNT